uniref:Addiction module antidote protein, HigA family n=1 Tax=Candidatus Kentrum sp. LFY TaxID=2126342 RepID=A0A450US30_9GAMM|nr:MAG: addiction module antidote protein, HigA family [Candidatus Kentron sp. LFY]
MMAEGEMGGCRVVVVPVIPAPDRYFLLIIEVPQRRIGEIVAGTRRITADTGLRLSRFFEMSEGFWVGLQMDHDAALTRDGLEETLARIRPWRHGEDALLCFALLVDSFLYHSATTKVLYEKVIYPSQLEVAKHFQKQQVDFFFSNRHAIQILIEGIMDQ